MLDPEAKVETARRLWYAGYSCSQSVAATFAPEMNMTEKQALRLSSGLGGGMGGLRVFCGAITSAFLVLGQLLGFDDADEFERKKWLYALEQNAAARFTEIYGTCNCRELMQKAGILVKAEPSPRTPEYYRVRPCGLYVEQMVRILVDILNEEWNSPT